MITTELNAISDEIAEIKKKAFEEGQEATRKELNKQIDEVHQEQERVAKLRNEWERMIRNLQNSYLTNNDKSLNMKLNYDSPFASSYGTLSVPADPEEFHEEITRLVQMGKDFEILLKHIKTNELLKGAWNKVLVAMRMIEQ